MIPEVGRSENQTCQKNTTGQIPDKNRSKNLTVYGQEIRPRINIEDRDIKVYRNGNSSIDLEAPDTFEGRNTL